MMQCFKSIIKNEGIWSLWKGLSGPMISMIFINGTVFMVEDTCLEKLHRWSGTGETEHFVVKHSVAGAIAGLVQSVIACPFELAKCRLQMEGKGQASSSKYRFGALSMLNEIRKHEKLQKNSRFSLIPGYNKYPQYAIFRGMIPTICREMPSFGAYFATYFLLVDLGIKNLGFREPDSIDMLFTRHFAMSLIFGGLAGCACWLVSYPADVIKTKIQMDGINGKYQYKGMWNCGSQIIKTEGGVGLWRGFQATMLRAFCVNAITFASTMLIKNRIDQYFDKYKNKRIQ